MSDIKERLRMLHTILGHDAADHIATLEASVAANQKAHERYEKVRKMNVPQFQNLYKRNITGEGRFDELVDRFDTSTQSTDQQNVSIKP